MKEEAECINFVFFSMLSMKPQIDKKKVLVFVKLTKNSKKNKMYKKTKAYSVVIDCLIYLKINDKKKNDRKKFFFIRIYKCAEDQHRFQKCMIFNRIHKQNTTKSNDDHDGSISQKSQEKIMKKIQKRFADVLNRSINVKIKIDTVRMKFFWHYFLHDSYQREDFRQNWFLCHDISEEFWRSYAYIEIVIRRRRRSFFEKASVEAPKNFTEEKREMKKKNVFFLKRLQAS